MMAAADAVRYYGREAVTRATPMPALIAALDTAFASQAFHAPARLAAEMDRASLLIMPAWKGGDRIGTKIVTVAPHARPSIRSSYLLTDLATGEPIALLDGATLTRRRTAAASVLAAGRLARKESATLLVIGTGALNEPLIEAYAAAFPLTRILIWGRNGGNARRAVAAARDRGFPAETVATIDTGLAIADIVTAATLSDKPLIAGKALRPGMHVDLIGAFRPDMCEADPVCFARSRVFVDTFPGALEEAGDLRQAIAGGAFSASAIEADLAALCTGKHRGRAADRDAITLFKSVGTAIEDLAAADLVVGSAI